MIDHQKVVEVIMSVAKLNNYHQTIDFTAPIYSLGIDSIDLFTILLELEKEAGSKINDQDIEKLLSIDDIVIFFNKSSE